MKLQGIFAEITTPFDHKGDIYKTKVEHNVEKWNRTTLAGYVVCGRGGEGELLAAEEKSAVWEMVAKWAAPEKMLIAATAMLVLVLGSFVGLIVERQIQGPPIQDREAFHTAPQPPERAQP